MVDTWLGFLLKYVENMGLLDKTAVIFTTDHGFYFGEHGGLFGKMNGDWFPDGTLRPYGEPGSTWTHSPLFEEIVHLPLLIHAPGIIPGIYGGLSSAVDVMPTVLDLLGMEIPASVQGRSLAPGMRDTSVPGREYVVSSIPFANPGDPVHSVDNLLRPLADHPVTTITAENGVCSTALRRSIGTVQSELRSQSASKRDRDPPERCQRNPSASGPFHACNPSAGPTAETATGTAYVAPCRLSPGQYRRSDHV